MSGSIGRADAVKPIVPKVLSQFTVVTLKHQEKLQSTSIKKDRWYTICLQPAKSSKFIYLIFKIQVPAYRSIGKSLLLFTRQSK
jgi:hypothetical protein